MATTSDDNVDDTSHSEKGGRTRLESDSARSKLETAGPGYYPVVNELLNAGNDALEARLRKMTKDYLLCLTRELVSQLRDTKHQLLDKNKISESLLQITTDVKELKQNSAVQTKKAQQQPIKVPVHDNPNVYLSQIKINGIEELKVEQGDDDKRLKILQHEENSVKKIFDHLGEKIHIKDCHRLGMIKKDNPRPRTMIVTLSNPWDVRKLIAKSHQLKTHNSKIFLSRCLSPADREIEKILLHKRWKLINEENIDRRRIKIRELKLFVDDKEHKINAEASEVSGY